MSNLIPWNKGLIKPKSALELKLDDDGKLKQRFYNKRVNAKAEGIDCLLTFEEYCLLVDKANLKSSQLGFTGDNYVLARYNDSGSYQIDNCRFIKHIDNIKERKPIPINSYAKNFGNNEHLRRNALNINNEVNNKIANSLKNYYK